MGPSILSGKRQGRKECLSPTVECLQMPQQVCFSEAGRWKEAALSWWVEPGCIPGLRQVAARMVVHHHLSGAVQHFPLSLQTSETKVQPKLRVSWPGAPAAEKLVNLCSFPSRKARGGGGKWQRFPPLLCSQEGGQFGSRRCTSWRK